MLLCFASRSTNVSLSSRQRSQVRLLTMIEQYTRFQFGLLRTLKSHPPVPHIFTMARALFRGRFGH